MTVVAEGIETAEELAYLRANTRIRYAQGYLFAKPFFLDDDAGGSKGIMTDGRELGTARESENPRRLAPTRGSRGG